MPESLAHIWRRPPAQDLPGLRAHIRESLVTLRDHLGMEVAFVTEFQGDRRWFIAVELAPQVLDIPLAVGCSLGHDEGYCQRIVDGRLPELIPDARALAAARDILATWALPIGAHLSVPIRLRSGRIFGTFCCFSRAANPGLGHRELILARVFADSVARGLEAVEAAQGALDPLQLMA